MLVSRVLFFNLAILNMIQSLGLQIINSLLFILTIPVICKIDSQGIQHLYSSIVHLCKLLKFMSNKV